MAQQPSNEGPDPGRSRERAEQDRMLARAARGESWLKQLWRHRWWTKGRPDPGNRGDADRMNR
jgi:hypothetical protein